MKPIKAILIDDSSQARRLLRLMLNELTPDVVICGEAANLSEGARLLRMEKPEVVFLDIEMPGKLGLELVHEVPPDELNYEIIFTTAYDQYAITAFRLSAIDYLLKPIKEEELKEAVDKVRLKLQHHTRDDRMKALAENLNNRQLNTFAIPGTEGFSFVKLANIIFIEADGAYAHIVMIDGSQKLISRNLKHVQGLLEGAGEFIRTHRSYIINLEHCTGFRKAERGIIIMSNGTEIPLSREHRQNFIKSLELIRSKKPS